ncbi:MAG TPA: type II CAAX endopeptidase family protein [Armatimonadota bacterium]|nr:type II CAAX endopeptidase family protein [Armatimonadota bacterium]
MPGQEPGPNSLLPWLLLLVALFFVVGDLVILGLWLGGMARERPLLARRWSIADLFLGLQAWLGFLIVVMLASALVLVAVGGLDRAGAKPSSIVVFYALVLPVMVWQQVAFVAVPLVVVRLKYGGTAADLGLTAPRRPAQLWALGLGLLIPLILVMDLLESVIRRLVADGVFPFAAQLEQLSREANALEFLNAARGQPVALVLLVLIVGLVGPVAEEVFFRGFAYRAFKERFGVRGGVVLSALLFALIHGNPIALVPIFVAGALLAWLYERTGSLAAPILLHCGNNLLSVLLYFLAPDFSIWERLLPR